MNTNKTRTLLLALCAGGLLLATGAAAADSVSSQQNSETTRDTQTVSIPTDNVLLALALGGSPTLADVANVHHTTTATSSLTTNRDISTNDALLALALQNGGSSFAARSLILGDGLGTSGLGLTGFGPFGFTTFRHDLIPGSSFQSETATRTLDQTVSFNEDTVLAALALGHGSFWGANGLSSVSNFDRTLAFWDSFDSRASLDDSSVLATLALRG